MLHQNKTDFLAHNTDQSEQAFDSMESSSLSQLSSVVSIGDPGLFFGQNQVGVTFPLLKCGVTTPSRVNPSGSQVPTLTVYTAPIGTPEVTQNGTSPAPVGHMYYVLTDSNGNSTSYGFAPAGHGTAVGIMGVIGSTPGAVYNTDSAVYQTPASDATTIPITQAQYETLTAFGTNPQSYGFGSEYQAFSNSCVDFTWAALSTIGIQEPDHFPGSLVLPQWNTDGVSKSLMNFENGQNGSIDAPIKYADSYNSSGLVTLTTGTNASGVIVTQDSFVYKNNGEYVSDTEVNASGTKTFSSTESFTAQSGIGIETSSTLFYSAGSVAGTQAVTSNSNGQESVNISGDVAPSYLEDLFNGSTITGSSNSTFSVTGEQNSITATSSVITVNGDSNTATLNNGSINVNSGSGNIIDGNYDTDMWAASVSGTVNGSNNNVVGTSSDALSLLGLSNSFTDTASGAQLSLGANSTGTFDFSSGGTVTTSNNDTFSVGGAQVRVNVDCVLDNVTASSDTVDESSGSSATLNGMSDSVFTSANDSLSMTGGNNTLDFQGANDTVNGSGDNFNWNTAGGTLNGVNEDVNGSKDVFGQAAQDNLLLSGGNDTVNGGYGDGLIFLGNSSSATVTNSGENVDFWSANDTVTGSNDQYSWNTLGGPESNVNEFVTGSGNIFNDTGTKDNLVLNGVSTSDTLNGLSGDGLIFNGGSDSATVTNSGENISFWGANDTVVGSNDQYSWNTLGGPESNVNEFVTGINDVFNDTGTKDNLVLNGVSTSDTLNGQSGDGLIFNGGSDSATVTNSGENISFWGANDTVFGSNDQYSWNTLGGPESNVNEFVTGSNNIFNDTGTKDNLVLSGVSTSDTLNGQSGDGLIFFGGSESATVSNSGENIDFWSANDTVNSSNGTLNWNTLGGPETNVSETVTGSNDIGTLATGDYLNSTGSNDVFTANNGDLFTFSGDSGATDGFNLANSNTNATGVFNNSDGTSQEQVFNPTGSTFAQIIDWSAPNDGGAPQDQTWEYDNGTSQSNLYNVNVSGGVQEADLTYDTADGIFGTTTALANDYYRATLDLTSADGGGSQVQLYDNTGSSLPSGTTMEYTDYTSSGAETDTTSNFASGTSITTDYNPEAGVGSVTGTFSGIDDGGNLENLNFGYDANGHNVTFDDRFTYSGNTQEDIYQSVYNTAGQRTGYAEFNAQTGALVQDYQGNYGYAGSGFSYNYAYGFGYGSEAIGGGGSNISQIGAHGRLAKGAVTVAHGDPSVRGKHRASAGSGGIAQIIARAQQASGGDVQSVSDAAAVIGSEAAVSTSQLVQAMASVPGQPLAGASTDFWQRLETTHPVLAASVT